MLNASEAEEIKETPQVKGGSQTLPSPVVFTLLPQGGGATKSKASNPLTTPVSMNSKIPRGHTA